MVKWYEASTGNHQGLIVEEGSGRNIAVAYDKADAPLIAAAPELLALLEKIQAGFESGTDIKSRYAHEVRFVIREAKGGL